MKANSQSLSGHRTAHFQCVCGLSSLHPTKEEPDLHEWDKSSCPHSFAPSFPCSLVAEHTLNAGRQVDTGDEVRGTRFLGEPELVG